MLCIDAAPNSYLATELAERGGGVARFLTSDPEEDDIATALDEVLADWSEPVLAGLRLEVDRPGVEAAGHAVAAGDRPAAVRRPGRPARRPAALGRRPRAARGGRPAVVPPGHGPGPRAGRRRVEPAGEAPEGRALKALFGARRVLAWST